MTHRYGAGRADAKHATEAEVLGELGGEQAVSHSCLSGGDLKDSRVRGGPHF